MLERNQIYLCYVHFIYSNSGIILILVRRFSRISYGSPNVITPYFIISCGQFNILFSTTSLQINSGLPVLRVSQPWCNEPLDSTASTIIVASEINARVLFRKTKFFFVIVDPTGYWETTRWFFIILSCRLAFSLEYTLSNGADDCDCLATVVYRSFMSCSIDSFCKSADNNYFVLKQALCNCFGLLNSFFGYISRTYN